VDERLVINSLGEFQMLRHAESQNFVCDRCLRPKTSKIVVTWVHKDSDTKTICNGCFGRLSVES
jgi:hypothetical protein